MVSRSSLMFSEEGGAGGGGGTQLPVAGCGGGIGAKKTFGGPVGSGPAPSAPCKVLAATRAARHRRHKRASPGRAPIDPNHSHPLPLHPQVAAFGVLLLFGKIVKVMRGDEQMASIAMLSEQAPSAHDGRLCWRTDPLRLLEQIP